MNVFVRFHAAFPLDTRMRCIEIIYFPFVLRLEHDGHSILWSNIFRNYFHFKFTHRNIVCFRRFLATVKYISAWNKFCKTKFSLFFVFSNVKRVFTLRAYSWIVTWNISRKIFRLFAYIMEQFVCFRRFSAAVMYISVRNKFCWISFS